VVEVQKAVWDNANDFERKFHSWCTLVKFTYDPTVNMATAFVLTVQNAAVSVIHPIIALGLNPEETVLYPSEHKTWAWMGSAKWQTVNLQSCVTWEHQRFICESNSIDAQDVCLDAEQGVCHFEIHPKLILPSKYHSIFCICNCQV